MVLAVLTNTIITLQIFIRSLQQAQELEAKARGGLRNVGRCTITETRYLMENLQYFTTSCNSSGDAFCGVKFHICTNVKCFRHKIKVPCLISNVWQAISECLITNF